MKLHEVLFAPCLSARPLLSCHRSIARASARVSARASVTGLLLVCHWSVAGLSLVCSGHGRWSWSLIVHPSCIARASLVCLFLFLLVCCSSVVGHGRCSACCSPVAPPACLSVGPSLSCHSSVCSLVAARPSLMYRGSACLSITGCRCPVPVQGHRFIAHPSVRASLVRLSLVRLSLVCSCVCRSCVCHSSVTRPSVTRPSARASLVRLLVHRSCVCHSSVTRLSLVRLLVRLSLVRLLVRLSLVRPLESGLLVAGPSLLSLTSLSVRSSLVCFLVHLLGSWSLPRGLPLVFHRSVVGHGRSCICSFVARCSARCFPVCCSVTSLSAVLSPVCLLGSWSLVRRSSICCPSLLRLLESW